MAPGMASEKPFKLLEEFTEGKIGGFALIKQAKENPDVLVKDIAILRPDVENSKSGSVFLETYDFDTFKREIVDPIKFLQEHGFEKFIPALEPVWAKDEDGEEKGFLIMKRVRGVDIEDLEKMSPRIAKEFDIFLSKHFEIESEAFKSGGDIISPDILGLTETGPMLSNLMVGKVSGDKEEHVYLVDLYPMKGSKDYFLNTSLEKENEIWASVISDLESRASGRYDFLSSRSAFKKYLFELENFKKRGGHKAEKAIF